MSTEAVERVRALAQSWASLPHLEDPREDHAAEIDRRVGEWLLGVLVGEPALALEGARIIAENWMKPGGQGMFYPAAGQAVLGAIRGASTETEAGWRARAGAAEGKLAAIRDYCCQRTDDYADAGTRQTVAGIRAILGSEGESADA